MYKYECKAGVYESDSSIGFIVGKVQTQTMASKKTW